MAANESVSLFTPEAIISYPFLWEPRASKTLDNKTGKPKLKYSGTFIFTEPATMKPLKDAYIQAVHGKFGIEQGNKMIRVADLKSPFLKNWEKFGYPEGSEFIRCSAVKKPGVVSRYRDPHTQKPAKITDPEKVYAGCLVIASVRLFWYEAEGNKGFSFGLNNVQVRNNNLSQYPRLDGRIAAEDEFEGDEMPEGELEQYEDSGDGDASGVDMAGLV